LIVALLIVLTISPPAFSSYTIQILSFQALRSLNNWFEQMGSMAPSKPHVVCLGDPKYAGADYLSTFSKTHTFSVLPATDRASTISLLPQLIAEKGPIDAFIIRMGTPPYEPFDAELLSALTPNCKIITSASAGYNEFDVKWMSSQGIIFCNSVDAVGEATADMAMFLLLATLRNTSQAEKSVRSGKWRTGGSTALTPARDPTGLTLGIVGMGAIGKVGSLSPPHLYFQPVNMVHTDANSRVVPREKGRRFQPQHPLLQPTPAPRVRRSKVRRHILLLPARPPRRFGHHLAQLPAQRANHESHLHSGIRRHEGRCVPRQHGARRRH
jgi:hypothetical protein